MKLAALSAVLSLASATTTHYLNWTLEWKTVNPDGLKDRQVVAINGQWPLPVVRISKGDRIVANVTNGLENPTRNSSIHWHGMFQNTTNDMDGPPMLTQCPSAPQSWFVYNFTVDQPGTYWYHAHVDNLYPDGYRQMLLVDNDDAWFQNDIDGEISFSLSDWYHELTQYISDTELMTLYNPTGAEPIPKSLLFNDTQRPRFEVEPSKTYRLRIANTAAFSGFYFYIPGHKFTIVEVDGVYTEPADAELIYVSTAQRYSLLFNTTSNVDDVYPMVQIADSSLYDVVPSDLVLNQTAWMFQGHPSEDQFVEFDNALIYKTAPVTNLTDNSELAGVDDSLSENSYNSENLKWFDDFNLVPYDHEPLLEPVTVNHTLHLEMIDLYDGKPYAFLNKKTFTPAKVPSLFTTLSAPSDELANNETIYGTDSHAIVLQHMDIVQIILNNDDTGKHPFHLHGHTFQAVLRAPDQGQETYVPYDPSQDDGDYPKYPMRRDTFVVLPNSHFLIRFRADNPGVWFFHCHIDWHLTQGLAVQLIEAPAQIRQNYKVHPLSASHYDACSSVNLAMQGNAAGNVKNFTNLSGENRQQKFLPSTFTARGIVALVFSIICAFVGMGFLCWYGATDITSQVNRTAEIIIEDTLYTEADEQTRREVLGDDEPLQSAREAGEEPHRPIQS